jgi:hypothetical protein
MLDAVIQRQENTTMTYKTLTVPLTEKEWQTLRTIAQCEYRNPRQQAAYLLRLALGLESPTKHETATPALQGTGGGFVESQSANSVA